MSTQTLQATTANEDPIFFEAGGEIVFGMFTHPTVSPRRTAVVSAPGGWFGTSAGRNRLLIRLSRLLAADGFLGFRFDYHGVGESTGTVDAFRLDRLFTDEMEGAIRTLRARGVDSFLPVGVCMGARVALSVARDLDGLAGLVLVSPPIHEGERPARRGIQPSSRGSLLRRARPWMVGDLLRRDRRALYLKHLRKRWRMLLIRLGRRRRSRDDRLSWVSPSLLEALEAVIDRRVPTLVLLGTEDANYLDFRAARQGRLGDLLRTAGGTVEIEMIDGPVHGFGEIRVQEEVIESIRRWAARLGDPSASDTVPPAVPVEGGRT